MLRRVLAKRGSVAVDARRSGAYISKAGDSCVSSSRGMHWPRVIALYFANSGELRALRRPSSSAFIVREGSRPADGPTHGESPLVIVDFVVGEHDDHRLILRKACRPRHVAGQLSGVPEAFGVPVGRVVSLIAGSEHRPVLGLHSPYRM